MSSAELRVFIDITIIEQIQKTAQKILRFVLHPRTKRIQNFKSVVLWRTHLCRISNLLIYSIEVITDSIGRGQQGDHVHKSDEIVKDKGCIRIC